MAELGNLWFRLGLDNREFEKTWKATLDKYSKEAKINIQASIQAANAASKGTSPYMQQKNAIKLQEFVRREAAKTAQQEAILQSKIKAEVTKTAIQQERLNKLKAKGVNSISLMNGKFRTQTRLVSGLNHLAGTYISIFAGAAVLRNMIRVSGEFEMQKVSLRAMLKDAAGADAIYAKTQNLALKSPFQFKELITYTKQLAAFSIPKDELYNTMKMLTDVSAGLGVGMDRITLAYGQIKAAAFLRGQEVRQLTEAGIPILEELAKQFSEVEGKAVSAGQVFDKISARLVPFEMVNKVFKDLTSEGGKFYNMQEIQAETLKGKISNLTDAYQKMYAEIGEKGDSVLKGGVDLVRNMIDNYEEVGKEIVALVATYGVYKATLLTLNLVTKTTTISNLAFVKSLKAIRVAMVKNPFTLIAIGVAAAGHAIYKYASYVSDAEKIQKTFIKATDEYNKVVASEVTELDRLYAKLKLAKKGTKEYDTAKKQIQSKYSTYLTQLEKEKGAVIEIADAYVLLKDKMAEANKSRFLESATSDAQSEYGKGVDSVYKDFQKEIGSANYKGFKLNTADIEALWQYVIGSVNRFDLVERGFKNANAFLNFDEGLMGNGAMEDLVKEYKNLTQVYSNTMSDIEKAFFSKNIGENDDNYIPRDFEKRIKDLLAQKGITEENKGKAGTYWVDEFTQYDEYLKGFRDRYAEIDGLIEDSGSTQKDRIPVLQEEKKLIEDIAKALGVSLEKEKKGGEDPKEIKALKIKEQQLKALKKFQDDTREYNLSDSKFLGYAKGNFPKIDDNILSNINYFQQLLNLAKEYQKLGREDYANDIFTFLGIADGKDTLKMLEAGEKFKNLMTSLLSQDFNIQGKGIGFDVSKIASDLQNSYAKINKEEQDAIELLGKSEMAKNEIVYNAKLAEIKDLYNKKRSYEKSLANEKLRDLAGKYISEIQGLDMTDFGNKTLGQINTIIDRLITAKDNIEFDDTIKEQAEKAGLSLTSLRTEIVKLLNIDIADTTTEKIKKIRDNAKDATSVISSFGSEFERMGDAIGNQELVDFGGMLQDLQRFADIILETDALFENTSKATKDAADNIKDVSKASVDAADNVKNIANSTDFITMALKIVLLLFSKIINIFSTYHKNQELLNEAQKEYISILNDIERRDFESILGVNEMALAAKNMEILTEAEESYQEVLNNFKNDKKIVAEGGSVRFKKYTTEDYLAGKFKIIGWDLYRKNGEINIDAVKLYYEKFADELPNKQRKIIKQLIDTWEEYEKATNASNEYLRDAFNSLGNDIANAMITSFEKTGSAVTDLKDISKSVMRSVLTDMINIIFFADKLEKYRQRAQEIASDKTMTDEEKISATANLFNEAAKELGETGKVVNEVLNNVEGLRDTSDTSNENNITRGTSEETSSLISSYINAIRADVSFNRISVSEINVEVKSINANIVNGISILTAIKENTFRSANNSDGIIKILKDAIGEMGSIKVDLINT